MSSPEQIPLRYAVIQLREIALQNPEAEQYADAIQIVHETADHSQPELPATRLNEDLFAARHLYKRSLIKTAAPGYLANMKEELKDLYDRAVGAQREYVVARASMANFFLSRNRGAVTLEMLSGKAVPITHLAVLGLHEPPARTVARSGERPVFAKYNHDELMLNVQYLASRAVKHELLYTSCD